MKPSLIILSLLLLSGCQKKEDIVFERKSPESVVHTNLIDITALSEAPQPHISREHEQLIREIVKDEMRKMYTAPTNGSPYYINPYRAWITNTPCILTPTHYIDEPHSHYPDEQKD